MTGPMKLELSLNYQLYRCSVLILEARVLKQCVQGVDLDVSNEQACCAALSICSDGVFPLHYYNLLRIRCHRADRAR